MLKCKANIYIPINFYNVYIKKIFPLIQIQLRNKYQSRIIRTQKFQKFVGYNHTLMITTLPSLVPCSTQQIHQMDELYEKKKGN